MFSTKYIILILGSLGWAYYQLWVYLFMPRNSSVDRKVVQRVGRMKKSVDGQRAHLRRERVEILYSIIDCVPGLGLKQFQREEYTRYIITTDKRVDGALISPEHIYVQQCLTCFLVIIVSLILALFNKMFILGCLACIPLWKIPLDNLKEKHHDNNVEIAKQFSKFYDLYYCQFISRTCTKKIIDICESFMPQANEAMRKMLERFTIDLEQDEKFALNELDYRYSDNRYIHKFCSIAKVRLQGDEAAFSSLVSFRDEIQNEIKLNEKRQLEKRIRTENMVIGFMLMFVFSLATIVFLGMMLRAS